MLVDTGRASAPSAPVFVLVLVDEDETHRLERSFRSEVRGCNGGSQVTFSVLVYQPSNDFTSGPISLFRTIEHLSTR